MASPRSAAPNKVSKLQYETTLQRQVTTNQFRETEIRTTDINKNQQIMNQNAESSVVREDSRHVRISVPIGELFKFTKSFPAYTKSKILRIYKSWKGAWPSGDEKTLGLATRNKLLQMKCSKDDKVQVYNQR